MSRLFYHTMQDNAGNLLFDVSGTMRIAGTGTIATIYGDEAMTVILPNPMTNHPSYGSFKCFLGVGDYDFQMSKAGYSFETLTGVQGYGGMAQQEANAVQITGGTATLSTLEAGTVNTTVHLRTATLLGVGGDPISDARAAIWYPKGTHYGIVLRALTADTGHDSILFVNTSGTATGSISTTGSTTAFNTTSDARLKEGIEPLAGALDVVRALNPVSFLWKADGSLGRGLIAQEVAEVVDGVITGEKDALDEDGQIAPQMIDYSKLVPYLIGAVKELTQQVEMLQAQLAAVGA